MKHAHIFHTGNVWLELCAWKGHMSPGDEPNNCSFQAHLFTLPTFSSVNFFCSIVTFSVKTTLPEFLTFFSHKALPFLSLFPPPLHSNPRQTTHMLVLELLCFQSFWRSTVSTFLYMNYITISSYSWTILKISPSHMSKEFFQEWKCQIHSNQINWCQVLF